jgi:hypothetical protein
MGHLVDYAFTDFRNVSHSGDSQWISVDDGLPTTLTVGWMGPGNGGIDLPSYAPLG